MCVQYLHIACKLGEWLVDCFLSIWDVQKMVSFWQPWKVNEMVSVQVSKAGGIVSLLQSCFIYVYSGFLTIVPVLSQIYIGTKTCYFLPLEICGGNKKKMNWECADFLVVPVTDGETKTETGFLR